MMLLFLVLWSLLGGIGFYYVWTKKYLVDTRDLKSLG